MRDMNTWNTEHMEFHMEMHSTTMASRWNTGNITSTVDMRGERIRAMETTISTWSRISERGSGSH